MDGVGKNARMYQPGAFKRAADRADASVHHVGRRDDIGAGIRVRACLAHQRFDCDVVCHVAMLVDDAVLPMRGEGIERHVGDHAQLRELLLDGSDRHLRDALGIPGFARVQSFLCFRSDREQGDCRDLKPYQGLAFAQQVLDRQPFDTGHRGHGLTLAAAFHHENRVNQRIHAQVSFTHQTA